MRSILRFPIPRWNDQNYHTEKRITRIFSRESDIFTNGVAGITIKIDDDDKSFDDSLCSLWMICVDDYYRVTKIHIFGNPFARSLLMKGFLGASSEF